MSELSREQAERLLDGLVQDKVSGVQVQQLLAHDASLRARLEGVGKERDKYRLQALVKFDCQVCSGALEKENDTLTARLRQVEEALKRLTVWAEDVTMDWTVDDDGDLKDDMAMIAEAKALLTPAAEPRVQHSYPASELCDNLGRPLP